MAHPGTRAGQTDLILAARNPFLPNQFGPILPEPARQGLGPGWGNPHVFFPPKRAEKDVRGRPGPPCRRPAATTARAGHGFRALRTLSLSYNEISDAAPLAAVMSLSREFGVLRF